MGEGQTTTAAAQPAVLTTDVPRLEDAEATRLAQELFGISGRVARLTSERDANFQVEAPDGRAFVLKLSNAAEDPAITNFQTAALRHIERCSPGLPVPFVCASLAGQDETTVTIAAGSRHVVRLLTYLRGEPLHRVVPSLPQAANLGRCLAGIGNSLRDFRHPAADHDLLWDLKSAARLRPLLPHVASDSHALVARRLDLEDDILPRLAKLRRQVVHNDLNPHNVLVDPADTDRVTGILDFGDMVDTDRVNHVAVGAAYQVGCPDMIGQIAAFGAPTMPPTPLDRPLSVDHLAGRKRGLEQGPVVGHLHANHDEMDGRIAPQSGNVGIGFGDSELGRCGLRRLEATLSVRSSTNNYIWADTAFRITAIAGRRSRI